MAIDWGLGYIPDGCIYDGYIAGVERLHPPLRFRRRPLLMMERVARLTGLEPVQREEALAKLLAEKVAEWDLKNPNTNQVVKIDADSMVHMQPLLYDKLYRIVAGEMPSDVPPNESREKFTADVTEQLGNSSAA